MEKLKGHTLATLPTGTLTKVSDLLEYDGPLLSHFKDEDHKNSHYLFYWVDFDENYNRWLVWKISDEQLYTYLKGFSALKELMEEPNKDFIYSVDIDSDLNYNGITAIDLEDIPKDYLIEEESYYALKPLPIYKSLLEKIGPAQYLANLREVGIYYRLSPRDKRFASTISTLDAGNFLKKITGSFLSFLISDFYNKFKDSIGDLDKLNKIISQIKEELAPRVVALKYGSFEVAISADVDKEIEHFRYAEWQKGVIQKYKEEVVDIDYDSEENLRVIAEKYEPDVRKKVFGPYIDLINDSDYNLEVSNCTKKYKPYKKVSKEKERIIIPKRDDDTPEIQEKALYNLVLELNKNEDFSKLKPKNLQIGTLFFQQVPVITLPLDVIVTETNRLNLKQSVMYQLSLDLDNATMLAQSNDFGILQKGSNGEEALKNFQIAFFHNFQEIRSGSSTLSDEIIQRYNEVVISGE